MNLGSLTDKDNEDKRMSIPEEETSSHSQDRELEKLVSETQKHAERLKHVEEGIRQILKQVDPARQKASESTTGSPTLKASEWSKKLQNLEKQVDQVAESITEESNRIGASFSNIVFWHSETRMLSPQLLATSVSPYLGAIADIQHVIDEVLAKPQSQIHISSIRQESPISVSLEGAADAVQIMQDTVVPWRRKHAELMACLQEQEKQADIESKRAEILEKRASASKSRAEAEKLTAEAAKQREEAEKLKLENEKLRLDLHRAKIQLALDMLNQLAPGLSETEKVSYLIKLLSPLDVIIFGDLEITTTANTKVSG